MSVYCGQTAGLITMTLGMEVSLNPDHFVLDRVQLPQFLADVCCGQTAGWIKMPLGMEVGLGPGHIALDGDPAPPTERRTAAPSATFRPISTVANRSPISATAELLLCTAVWDNKGDGLLSRHHKFPTFTGTTDASNKYDNK